MDQNLDTNELIEAIRANIANVIKITSITVVIALSYLLFFYPPIFRSAVTVVHSGNNMQQSSQASGIMSSLGVSIPSGGSSTAAPEIVVQILKSDSFSRSLVQRKFYYEKFNQEIPLYQIIFDDLNINNSNEFLFQASKVFQQDMFIVSKDRMTNVINFVVVTSEAQLSRDVALEALSLLNNSFNAIEKEKALQKSLFIESRLIEEKEKLKKVEDRYIEFKNKNQLMSESPLLKIKEQSIQRDLSMSTTLVSMLMQQLEMTQLDLYDEMNEVMVINQPEVMPYRANRRIFLLIGSVIAGLVFSMSYIMAKLLLKYRDK
jgi:capsule polysaccharide export protein KpsE/RkpR